MSKPVPAGWNKGKGASYRFLVNLIGHEGDECVLWPFSLTRGYGALSHMGKRGYAHRMMCELKHGPAPSDTHEAAHSCGNNSCVNPNHLDWKTPTENMLDCRLHGTHVRSRYGSAGKITREQAAEIRMLKGIKKLREIAAEYDISESAVSNIWVGRTHLKPSKLPPKWTADDIRKMKDAIDRACSFKEVAEIVGRPFHAVMTKAYRLGLKSKYIPLVEVG